MVARFGELVASGQVSPEDIGIHFVEKDSSGDSSIRLAEYSEDGIIKNWPIGFFSARG